MSAEEKKTQHEKDHPYGTTLLARDKPENRRQWGADHIGYVDVEASECDPTTGRCPHYAHRSDATRDGPVGVVPVSYTHLTLPTILRV